MTRYEELRHGLIAEREARGWSQTFLAKKMDVSPTWLSSLEAGKRQNVTVETLMVWVRALGGRLIVDVDFN